MGSEESKSATRSLELVRQVRDLTPSQMAAALEFLAGFDQKAFSAAVDYALEQPQAERVFTDEREWLDELYRWLDAKPVLAPEAARASGGSL